MRHALEELWGVFDPGKVARSFKNSNLGATNRRMDALRNRRRTNPVILTNQNQRARPYSIHPAVLFDHGLGVGGGICMVGPHRRQTGRRLLQEWRVLVRIVKIERQHAPQRRAKFLIRRQLEVRPWLHGVRYGSLESLVSLSSLQLLLHYGFFIEILNI